MIYINHVRKKRSNGKKRKKKFTQCNLICFERFATSEILSKLCRRLIALSGRKRNVSISSKSSRNCGKVPQAWGRWDDASRDVSMKNLEKRGRRKAAIFACRHEENHRRK